MEEFLEGLDCKLRADSIMLGIVNSAMEQAFDKACSKEGVIERLNEKSRFCVLAVMQLEWALRFVQKETDNHVLVESIREREKLVSDLTETRDRIQRRLEETEMVILEKDREFSERFESELKLRQALEVKDREVFRVSGDDGRDGDFCELKNSVDQQVFNIKQKLEDERMNYTKMSQGNVESDWLPVDEGNYGSDDEKKDEFYGSDNEVGSPVRPEMNKGFEKMGSDIDVLKETLDFAFGMMGNAISLSEVAPMEQQWRWTVEKDTIGVVFRGFLKEVEQGMNIKVSERKKQGSVAPLGENWSHLMDEITSLRHDLEALVKQVEIRGKGSSSAGSSTVTSPAENSGGKLILQKLNWLREKPPLDASHVSAAVERFGKPGDSSLKAKEQNIQEEPSKEDSSGQVSSVSQIIKNHESIIRKKSEELNANWLKSEFHKDGARKDNKERDTISKRMKDIIARLDSIIERNAELGTSWEDDGYADGNDSVTGDLSEEVRQQQEDGEDPDLKTGMIETIYGVIFKSTMKELHSKLCKYVELSDEVRQLKEEREDSELKTLVMENVFSVTSKSMMKELHLEINKYDVISLMREDVYGVYLKETVEEWKETIASVELESSMREEMYQLVFVEALKDTACKLERNEEKIVEVSAFTENYDEMLGGLIMDGVQTGYLREMVQDWIDSVESFNISNQMREEVFQIVFHELMRHIDCNQRIISKECHKARTEGNLVKELSSIEIGDQKLESTIRHDVSTVLFRETIKECEKKIENFKSESLISEEVLHVVFREMMRHMDYKHRSILAECHKAIKGSLSNDLSSMKLQDQTFEGNIRDDVFTRIFREVIKEWEKATDDYTIKNLIRKDVYNLVIVEGFKEIRNCLTELQEARNQYDVQTETPTRNDEFQRLHVGEMNSLAQTLESSPNVSELEEDLRLSPSLELIEQIDHNGLFNAEFQKLDNSNIHCKSMMVPKEVSLGPVNDKSQLNEMQYFENLGSKVQLTESDSFDKPQDQMSPIEETADVREVSLCTRKGKDELQKIEFNSVVIPITEFSKSVEEFDCSVQEKLDQNILRLEEVKHRFGFFLEHVPSIKKKELLYRNAFLCRCHNLRKAEAEVDLLGDEVDALLILLKRIYVTLNRHSPVLQQHVEIMDILDLIRKELNGPSDVKGLCKLQELFNKNIEDLHLDY